MHPILLTGFPLGSSLGLVAAFEWLGQPYQLARVDMMGGDMHTAAYQRLNGRRQTPVLIRADGTALTETLAIAHWLQHHDTGRHISPAPGSAASDRMWQYAAFLNTGFTAAFVPYWVAMEAPDLDEGMRGMLPVFGRTLVNAQHAQLEAMLPDTPFIGGERPDLADAIFVGVARWAEFHKAIDPLAYPKIGKLRMRLEAEPAVRFAAAIESGQQAPGHADANGQQIPLAEALAATGAGGNG